MVQEADQRGQIEGAFHWIQLIVSSWKFESIWCSGTRDAGTDDCSALAALLESLHRTAESIKQGESRPVHCKITVQFVIVDVVD